MKDKVIPWDTLKNDVHEVEESVNHFMTGWKKFSRKALHVAIGIIVAAQFERFIGSIVSDLLLPCVMIIFSSTTEDLFLVLYSKHNDTFSTLNDAKNAGAITLNYGRFLHILTNVIFVTLTLYIMVKIIKQKKL